MHSARSSIAAACAVVGFTSAVLAQPAPSSPALPGPDASASSSAAVSAAPFSPPSVDDAYLRAVPEAQDRIGSWTQAVERLRARSTDMQLAMLEVVRAEAQARVALAGSLPTITGSANLTDNLLRKEITTYDTSPMLQTPPGAPIPVTTTIPAAVTYGGTLTLTQPLLALRAWHAKGTAEMAKDAARLGVLERKRTIALGAASAIVSVVTAERVAELNRVGLRGALERLQLTRRRFALGASNALDVLRVEQDAAQARGAIVQGDDALLRSREALGLALGVGHPVGVEREISLDDILATTRRMCEAQGSIEQRADILSARKQVELGERSIRDAELQYAPKINFVSRTDLYSERLANSRHVAWSIAGVLTVPIWDGGAREGYVREASVQRDQAVARAEAARRGARIEVEQARRAVTVAESALAVSRNTRDLAMQQEKLAKTSFEIGKATSFELVDAGRQLRAAEINLAVAEFNLVEAKLAAHLALAKCAW